MKTLAILLLLYCSSANAQDYINGPAWGPSFRQINQWQQDGHFGGPYIPPAQNSFNWNTGNGLHRGSYGIVFDARTGTFLYPQSRYYTYPARQLRLVRKCQYYWSY